MKVYVVGSIPDYIGMNIEFVFLHLFDAEKCCSEHNAFAPSYDKWFVEEHEVL